MARKINTCKSRRDVELVALYEIGHLLFTDTECRCPSCFSFCAVEYRLAVGVEVQEDDASLLTDSAEVIDLTVWGEEYIYCPLCGFDLYEEKEKVITGESTELNLFDVP